MIKAYDFQLGRIRVTRDFVADLPRTMADEHQLIQVLLNVLTNAEQAMRATRGRGRLVVRTSSPGNWIKISISDDGPGIRPNDLGRVFEPFFTTKSVGDGTGLGLSISHGIVSQHGGEIWAESTLGEGTTFHIELPAAPPQAREEPPPAVPEQAPTKASRPLLVDEYAGMGDLSA